MKLPIWFTEMLARRMDRVRQRRPADLVIGEDYLSRWFLAPWAGRYRDVENPTRWQRFVRIAPVAYHHVFTRSDDDRALHDHPAASMTIVLRGSYREHVPVDPNDPAGPTVWHHRAPGDIVFRRATSAHRIELPGVGVRRCETLFLFGFRLRRDGGWWGFWCKWGWRHQRDYLKGDRGCD